jgi:phage shock protein C
MTKKLKRSQTNRTLTGVCGGIAEYLNMDATVIRIIFVIATIVGFGSPVLIYLILMFIMPDKY